LVTVIILSLSSSSNKHYDDWKQLFEELYRKITPYDIGFDAKQRS